MCGADSFIESLFPIELVDDVEGAELASRPQ